MPIKPKYRFKKASRVNANWCRRDRRFSHAMISAEGVSTSIIHQKAKNVASIAGPPLSLPLFKNKAKGNTIMAARINNAKKIWVSRIIQFLYKNVEYNQAKGELMSGQYDNTCHRNHLKRSRHIH